MIKEHKRAVLIVDLPLIGLKAGDMGTVVHVYPNDAAYEIEFFTLDRHTIDVVTVAAEQVRPVSRHDILHARVRTA